MILQWKEGTSLAYNHAMTKPLAVHVLIDLEWRDDAGGHIKCWERLAEAATQHAEIDLTLHVAGQTPRVKMLAPHVRFQVHKPVFSTRNIPFLGHVPDHSDLAGFHPRLADALRSANVIHTTDAFFNYAHTAEKVSKQYNIPLTHSVHTDTVSYTELFTASMLATRLGAAGKWLDEQFGISTKAAEDMRTKLRRHQQRSRFVLTSRKEDHAFAAAHVGEENARAYRLGLDFSVFKPDALAREKLNARYAIPPDAALFAFVGRLDEGKNIYTLIQACEAALKNGQKIFLIAAGIGPAEKTIHEKLVGHAATPGFLQAPQLAELYAGADWLVLPSQVETWSMAAAEALACGLPVIAAAQSGVGRFVQNQGAGLLVDENTPHAWAQALGAAIRLKDDKGLRQRAVNAAHHHFPSWEQALAEDFIPIWQKAAGN